MTSFDHTVQYTACVLFPLDQGSQSVAGDVILSVRHDELVFKYQTNTRSRYQKTVLTMLCEVHSVRKNSRTLHGVFEDSSIAARIEKNLRLTSTYMPGG